MKVFKLRWLMEQRSVSVLASPLVDHIISTWTNTMLSSLNVTACRSILICFSTLVLCACFFWTGSVGSVLAACPRQDKAAAAQAEEPQVVDEEEGLVEEEAVENEVGVMANFGLDPQKMLSAKRFKLTQTFRVEVEELTRILDLDAKQQKKLSIAAKGATKKILAQWSKKRRIGENAAQENESKTDDEKVEITDADQIDEQTLMMMDSDPATGSPFGSKPPLQNLIWKKMLTKVLTTQQLTVLKAFRAKQAKAKRAAQIATMMQILNAELALSSAQSEELQQLITPQIDAAKPVSMALYDMFLTLYYASKVDEDNLKNLLSGAQHQKWKLLMLPMKSFGEMVDRQAEADQAVDAAAEEIIEEVVEE